MARRKRRSPKKASKGMLDGVLGRLAGPAAAVGYGFFREKISDAVNKIPMVQKIPATGVTDELVMLGVGWGAGKLGVAKNPIGRKILKAHRNIEFGRIGEELADMHSNRKGTSPNGQGALAATPSGSVQNRTVFPV